MVSTIFTNKASTRKAGVIFMQEIWKDIPGYEGFYQVSNTGKVKSFQKGKPLFLKTSLTKGYVTVNLFQNKKIKKCLVHRLVALAFIPNPNNYREINHKDENKLNNCVDNLEWCTRSYNMAYGTARLRQGISNGNSIKQCIVGDIEIARYCSAEIASQLLNIDASSIIACCKGKRGEAGGYFWKYCD